MIKIHNLHTPRLFSPISLEEGAPSLPPAQHWDGGRRKRASSSEKKTNTGRGKRSSLPLFSKKTNRAIVVSFRPSQDHDTYPSTPWTIAWHMAIFRVSEEESLSHQNSEQLKQPKDRDSRLRVPLSSSQIFIQTWRLQLGSGSIISTPGWGPLDKDEHVLYQFNSEGTAPTAFKISSWDMIDVQID